MTIGKFSQPFLSDELGISRSTISTEVEKGDYMRRDGKT